MSVNPLGMNQGTNSFIRFEDDGGTVNTQVIDVRQGTITKLQGGTIGNLVSGTINSATAVLNSGTINVATAQVSGGTLGLLQAGTITRLEGGTMQLSGTPNVNIISGSVQMTAGTITGGTVDTTSNAVVSGTASTTTTLAAGGTWTGGTIDLLPYNTIRLSAYSDVDSASNGLKLRYSNDGTNWDITRQTTLIGSVGVYAAFNRVARYFSPQYINGAGSQTAFRLQTVLTPNSPEFTRRFLSEVPVSSNAGIITQSNIFGTSTAGGGAFVQVKVSPSGAMQVGGAVDITSGTQQTLGTVGVVSNLTNGSIVVTNGTIAPHAITAATITAGTLTNLVSGTINSATVVLNSGTINVATATVGTIPGVGVITSLSGGTITKLEGGTLGILSQGSINVTAGTITHGTIDAGTVKLDGRAARNIVSYGTTFGGTAAGYATLAGSAGAGTSIWVNDLSIINSKGGTITALIGFGTALNGTSVLAKGDFGAQGGIQKSFPLAVNAGMTNQDLVAYIGAAGTIDVCVSYFISA